MGFAISGHILFGYRVDSFRSAAWSFISCFKTTVGGSDYNEMVKVSPYIAPIYFTIFSLSFSLVMLNMFVAIIAIYYKETVKDISEEEEPSLLKMIENELRRALDEEVRKAPEESTSKAIAKLPFTYRLYAKVLSVGLVPEENEVQVRREENSSRSDDESSEEAKNENELPNPPLVRDFLQQIAKCKSVLNDEKSITLLEQTKPVYWLSTLEATAANNAEYKRLVHDTIRQPQDSSLAVEFYPKLQIDSLSAKVKDFVLVPKRSKEQLAKWSEATLEVKYSYWCGLEALYSESYPNGGIEEQAEDSKGESLRSDEIESSLSDQEPRENHLQLVPPVGGITLEGMFQSQEYRSTYAVAVSLAEWQYWNDMNVEDKIAMWILLFTGKQRAKVWKRMQFSKAGVNDYLNRNGIEKDEEKDFEHIWLEDLTDSKNVYRHKIDLLNCKCPMQSIDLLYGRRSNAIGRAQRKFLEKHRLFKAQLEEARRMRNDANKENLQASPKDDIITSARSDMLKAALKLYNTHRSNSRRKCRALAGRRTSRLLAPGGFQ